MAEEEFRGAIEEAKRLERKLTEYMPYQGEMSVERTIDLDPREFVDLTYNDMINLYERTQKIIKTTGMGILAAKEEAPPPSAESGEVESKLREMTTETLKTAEEVAKEPIVIEKEIPRPEAPAEARAIEFEERPTVMEKEELPPEAPGLELEKEKPAERPAEKAEEPKVEVPLERKVIVAAVPPALAEPGKVAERRYAQMEEQIRMAVGEKADEITLKKKMLELTKQLFKEKTTSKREELKLQITILKNMLAGAAAGATPAAGARKARDDTYGRLYDTLLSTHQSEIAQTKDEIIDSYNKQIAGIKKKFYEDISASEDPSSRKQIFESFVFSVTSLIEQMPEVLEKYTEFTKKKHAAEMEKVRDSVSPEDRETKSKVEERLEYINTRYEQEFASVKGIVGRDIENLIEVAGSEIFKRPEEKPKETSEAKAFEIVKDINDTDEGTLLYFLHSKDPDYYKKYERKLVSKAEAIFKAKELMAKEKGLSDSMVTKYFSQLEG
jgi:hypothetical protein